MSKWQPIETAPKDRLILLWRCGGFDVGVWDSDARADVPQGYWRSFLQDFWGGRWMRQNPLTHWAKLPEGPAK